MTQETFKRVFLATTPFIAVLVLSVFYVLFVSAFIKCTWGFAGCQALQIENVLLISAPQTETGTDNSAENNVSNRIHQVSRYSNRITWGFLTMTYILLSLVTLVVASGLIYKIFADWENRPLLWLLITLAASAVFSVLLFSSPETYMSVLKPLLERTIKTEIREIVHVVVGVDSIGLASSFTLVLASCAILLPPYNDSFPDGLRELSKRMKHLRIVLYVGTLLLIVGVLLMRSILNWSLAFIPRTDDGFDKIVESFASSIVSAEAGFYTLMLAGVYLPAAFILQWRARALRGLPEDASARDKELQDYGLTFSLKESLPRIVAILGPFLVGPVGEFFKQFPKE